MTQAPCVFCNMPVHNPMKNALLQPAKSTISQAEAYKKYVSTPDGHRPGCLDDSVCCDTRNTRIRHGDDGSRSELQ